MNKNTVTAIIIILIILCVGEGYFVVKERNEKIALSMVPQNVKMPAKPSPRPRPMFITRGQNFADNPLSKKAYLIAPVTGDLSADAKRALTGWDVKTTNNTDGSVQVNLVPHETEDVQQQFTVKPGYKLYFIELTLADDSAADGDANRADDIGVLVNSDGIVQ